MDDQRITGTHHGIEIPHRILAVLQHGCSMWCITSEPVALLNLKVGEIDGAGAVGDKRSQRNADHTFFFFYFYTFAEAYEIINHHSGSPIQCPLNFTDMTNPASSNTACLQHDVSKIHCASAVRNAKPNGDGA